MGLRFVFFASAQCAGPCLNHKRMHPIYGELGMDLHINPHAA